MIARIGGEEFAVLLPQAGLETVGAVAERVRQTVESLGIPHACGAAMPVVTISCGGASAVAGRQSSPEDLFRAADEALYSAKREGRNRVRLREATIQKAIEPANAGPAQTIRKAMADAN